MHLLGDSAYACSDHLLTPYRDNGHLTARQKNFNRKLSSCRVYIEHTFGLLKQRFRQLYYCKLRGLKYLCHFIRATCVLHNLCDMEDEELFLSIPLTEVNSNEITEENETRIGRTKRDFISANLNL